MRKKSVVVAKGSRLREEPKRETGEKLIANGFFIHETEKLQRREPVIPGLLSQKLFNIMTVVLCDHGRDGLRVSVVDCDDINPYQRDKLEWSCEHLISLLFEKREQSVG